MAKFPPAAAPHNQPNQPLSPLSALKPRTEIPTAARPPIALATTLPTGPIAARPPLTPQPLIALKPMTIAPTTLGPGAIVHRMRRTAELTATTLTVHTARLTGPAAIPAVTGLAGSRRLGVLRVRVRTTATGLLTGLATVLATATPQTAAKRPALPTVQPAQKSLAKRHRPQPLVTPPTASLRGQNAIQT
ncbi:MAG: hypothetical protein WBD47_00595 [Phormidesmis sp.]